MNNNALDLIANVITMSSVEIATLTGKDHKNVLRDIDKMLIDLYPDENERNPTLLKFETRQKFEQQRETRCFNLDKEHTLILVSGYSTVLRAKIIRRWQELESQQVPQTLSESLFLAAKLAKENEQLVHEGLKKDQVIEKQNDTIETISEVIESHTLFKTPEITKEKFKPSSIITQKDLPSVTHLSVEASKRLLDFVGHPKIEYGQANFNTGESFGSFVSYERDGIEESIQKALSADYSGMMRKEISKSGDSLILCDHPAFLGGRVKISFANARKLKLLIDSPDDDILDEDI